MRLSQKKGTHVGMILSFLIFVTFLAFLYSITQPATKVKQDKLDLVSYLEIELMNKFSENLTIVTVQLGVLGCVKFDMFDKELNKSGAIAKKVTGTSEGELETKIDSSIDTFGRITINSGSENEKTKFYYSNQFNKSYGPPCGGSDKNLVKVSDYNITLYRTSKEIFESKIKNISKEINNSREYYNQLKDELGMAFDDEFGFTFRNSSREVIAGTEEKEANIDIYSEEIPIQYIDGEANIKPGFLVIKVW